jgi:hypothetical protein
MYYLLAKKSIEIINLIKKNNYTIPYSCNLLLDDNRFLYDNNILNQSLKKEYGLNAIIENVGDDTLLINIENMWYIIVIVEEINHLEIFISSFVNKKEAIDYIEKLNS